MNPVLNNQRGVALIITLLVVALLTITVVEFTYSVQVDQHMGRNALNALQASLLARSGINLGEAILLHDDDWQVDAYTEDWCPTPTEGGCRIDETTNQLLVPDNMRLRVMVIDEGGKLNFNLTRPRDPNSWRVVRHDPAAPIQIFQAWRKALEHLMESRGVDLRAADAVEEYWNRVFDSLYGDQPPTGAPATAATAAGAAAAAAPGAVGTQTPTPRPDQLALDFPSLDDAGVIPGLTPQALRRLRPVVTALPFLRQLQVNANTAPREVLLAILQDEGVVEDIVSQRQEAPLKATDVQQIVARVDKSKPETRYVAQMVGARSSYFLIHASAIVNPNPVTGLGGIGRSASMLVQRVQNPRVPPGAPVPPGMSRWTLTRLDWQKEGGAALFMEGLDQDAEAGDLAPPAGR